MILRRLVRHLQDQNWLAVALEFLIVVTGVFLGVQADRWNEMRREGVRAESHLQRIHADLATDLQDMEARVAFRGEVIAHGEAALAYAESDSLKDGSTWETILAFSQASQLWPFTPSDVTYQELRSAGELGLVRSDALRQAMGRLLRDRFGDPGRLPVPSGAGVSGGHPRGDPVLRAALHLRALP